jgi:hypothetical protein
MKFKSNFRSVWFLGIVASVALCNIGCGSNDNRTPTPEELKTATTARMKYMDTLNMPESAKKELESRTGGPPYTNPAIGAAIAAAKAKGAHIDSKTRTQ